MSEPTTSARTPAAANPLERIAFQVRQYVTTGGTDPDVLAAHTLLTQILATPAAVTIEREGVPAAHGEPHLSARDAALLARVRELHGPDVQVTWVDPKVAGPGGIRTSSAVQNWEPLASLAQVSDRLNRYVATGGQAHEILLADRYLNALLQPSSAHA